MTNAWPCEHFSLTNPRDNSLSDLPKLLRRLATEIEDRHLDPIDILDVTVTQEMTDDGPWWSATLYWAREDAAISE